MKKGKKERENKVKKQIVKESKGKCEKKPSLLRSRTNYII